ncbi:S-adenosyl-L-methionine-dependent methyltransferase [Aspergillus heteromorphus CBS 117.55]|uniref:S-adenosyl-L-methionine-dependent methyltransferase n=1 Tax=Aspergillus heteromorphus CBS 117.55 TaxID=1448321 RepID=A0A317WVN3_9EURO|nr:S-adenosyl-L-methionine-dependent methyltransferase [Aspergillus heteromorphus CBS 117.55]PWY89891.1 S-adenosyl-L-methionine-dependent methyltransferase [Aspergillus heteromorphus CBS 117.55]
MSLYYDAVTILTAPAAGGSFKSRIYNSRTLKASPAQVYALIIEASKWDLLLKEVIEHAGILKLEPKLTPLLATLLVHDHLLSKSGIAAKTSHPFRQAIERHKARLRGEFTKARVRRGCATIEDLKSVVRKEKLALLGPAAAALAGAVHPRWVRVNNLKSCLQEQLDTTFRGFERVEDLRELGTGKEKGTESKKVWVDPHVPDLVAIAQGVEISSSAAYREGKVILQDKASCFPAYLLLGDEGVDGDLLDGCAAPGNKTTHMASLVVKVDATAADVDSSAEGKKQRKMMKEKKEKGGVKRRVYSMDQSPVRAKILQKMVTTAGADSLVTVLPGQDFLALDPEDERFEGVTGLLLDPSCSGSGIVGRDDVPKLILPEIATPGQQTGKKRKRNKADGHGDDEGKKSKKKESESESESAVQTPSATDENDVAVSGMDAERLVKLSNLQTRIVEHALGFPAATRVTYSTCSVHLLENEAVVQRILASEVARERGWRVLRRDEQPEGMRKWGYRGVREERVLGDGDGDMAGKMDITLSEEELEGCLRCWPGDDQGTGGFFVAGFVRDGAVEAVERAGGAKKAKKQKQEQKPKEEKRTQKEKQKEKREDEEEDEWDGFSD